MTAPLRAIFGQRLRPSSSESDGHKQWSLWYGAYGLIGHAEDCREELHQSGTHGVTLGLLHNPSVWRIKGNQATFDNSQRNNLRSCVWVRFGSVGDVRADFSFCFREKTSLFLWWRP